MIMSFREYNDILKAIKWPLCGTDVTALYTSTPEIIMKFKIITEYLFYIQLPYPYILAD